MSLNPVRRVLAARGWAIILYPTFWFVDIGKYAGPWGATALLARPPLWLGLLAGMAALGAASNIFVEGYYARYLVQARLGSAGPALMMRCLLGIGIFLVPLGGIWSSALELLFHPDRLATPIECAALILWHLANSVPLIDVPAAVGQPAPPIPAWGAWTGAAVLLASATLLWAILLTLAALVRDRSTGPVAPTHMSASDFRALTRLLPPGTAKWRSLLVESVFLPVLLVATIPFRSHPASRYSIGMALTGGLVNLAILGGAVAALRGHWSVTGVALYWWVGARLLHDELRQRQVIP